MVTMVAEIVVPKTVTERITNVTHIWNGTSGKRLVRRPPCCDVDVVKATKLPNQACVFAIRKQYNAHTRPQLRNPQLIAMYSYVMVMMMIYVSTLSRPLHTRLHNTEDRHSSNIMLPFHRNLDYTQLSIVLPFPSNTTTSKHAVMLPKTRLLGETVPLDTMSIPSWKELFFHGTRRTSEKYHKPRVWPKEIHTNPRQRTPTYFQNSISNHSSIASEKYETVQRRMTSFRSDCKPRSEWHTYTFPTCNMFHEIDWEAGLTNNRDQQNNKSNGIRIQYLEKGGSRDTWSVQWNYHSTTTVLKTLRWRKQYDPVVFGHQRMDALALERLTSSQHVVNIFGFCAMSTINEYAEIGNFGKEFLINPKNFTWLQRLIVARDASLALAAVHDIDGPENPVSMVHHDFSPKNLVVVDGKLQLSDFNDAKLRRWNFESDTACSGFNWDGFCGSSTERTHRRSPEECMGRDDMRRGTDEKPEIYHLGSVLYFLLAEEEFPYYTEFSHSGIRHKLIPSAARKHIIAGTLPMLPRSVEEMNDDAVQALIHAMKSAYNFSPEKRPRARDVAAFLNKTLEKIKRKNADENTYLQL